MKFKRLNVEKWPKNGKNLKKLNFSQILRFFDIFGQFLSQENSFKTQNGLNWKSNISTFNKAEKDGTKSKMADTGGLRPTDDLVAKGLKE